MSKVTEPDVGRGVRRRADRHGVGHPLLHRARQPEEDPVLVGVLVAEVAAGPLHLAVAAQLRLAVGVRRLPAGAAVVAVLRRGDRPVGGRDGGARVEHGRVAAHRLRAGVLVVRDVAVGDLDDEVVLVQDGDARELRRVERVRRRHKGEERAELGSWPPPSREPLRAVRRVDVSSASSGRPIHGSPRTGATAPSVPPIDARSERRPPSPGVAHLMHPDRGDNCGRSRCPGLCGGADARTEEAAAGA